MGKIVLLIGESGTGKNFLKSCILQKKEFSKYDFKEIVMHTTRPLIAGETNGKDYFFVSNEEMEQLYVEGKIIEKRIYETNNGIVNYFTSIENIDLKNNYLTVSSLDIYDKYVSYFGKEVLIPILINVDPGVRLERTLEKEIIKKEPNYINMCSKFLLESKEYSLENIAKRNIEEVIENNETIEETLESINKILIKKL